MSMNIFDFAEPKKLVEGFKYSVINAWYTNAGTNVLAPCASALKDKKIVMAITKLVSSKPNDKV